MNLTFKQYLESKEQLRKAIDNVPVSISEYEVIHYCTIPLGEFEEDKVSINLKPKQRMVVEWQHDSVEEPTPISIRFIGVQSLNEDDEQQTLWTNGKFQKWVRRHTREVK